MNSAGNLKAVLLVDDDRQLAETLQTALRGEDYLVDVAHDGEEAFLKIKVHQYDAVVCDMMMPKLRGDQLYRQAVVLHPELTGHFLFITGFADDPAVRKFLSSISARYLLKPFAIQDLINAVQTLGA